MDLIFQSIWYSFCYYKLYKYNKDENVHGFAVRWEFLERERDRETEREIERGGEREKGRERDRKRDRKRG